MIVFPIGNEIFSLPAMKCSSEKFRINGMVTTVITPLIAVKVIERAVSPLETWLIRFEVTPHGQIAKIINPTANSGLNGKIFA